MGATSRDRVLPTPAQLRLIADDAKALYTAIEVWADRPYHELADLMRALSILTCAEHARLLERNALAAARVLDPCENDDD